MEAGQWWTLLLVVAPLHILSADADHNLALLDKTPMHCWLLPLIIQDAVGNIVIKRPGTGGGERAKPVVIQVRTGSRFWTFGLDFLSNR